MCPDRALPQVAHLMQQNPRLLRPLGCEVSGLSPTRVVRKLSNFDLVAVKFSRRDFSLQFRRNFRSSCGPDSAPFGDPVLQSRCDAGLDYRSDLSHPCDELSVLRIRGLR